MSRNILLTGGSGLVGSYFKKFITPSRQKLDITSLGSVAEFFNKFKPQVVVHAAAKVGILAGEKERDNKKGSFWQTNIKGTGNIVSNCLKYQAYLIFISAEVVFSGTKERPGPYSEDDAPEIDKNSLSWYGWTKAEAERLVKQRLPAAAIVRLSNVVGKGIQPRPDYLRKIILDYDQGKPLFKFTDQYIGLTESGDYIKVVNKLIKKKLPGVFHVSSVDQFTPYECARILLEKIRHRKGIVKPESIRDYLKDHPVTFPQYCGLKVEKTQQILNAQFTSWREIVDRVIT